MKTITALICCGVFLIPTIVQGDKSMSESDWQKKLSAELPVFGHRNWIVVADSAYPAQSGAGIETIHAGGDHLEVIRKVIEAVEGAKHISPVIHVDRELKSVADADAPGIDQLRGQMDKLLDGKTVKRMMHEDIIRELDEAGKLFRVLIIKTDCRLPYTSMFIQLDCGYWGPEKEERLRQTIKDEQSK